MKPMKSRLAFSAPAYAHTLEVLPTDHDFGDVEVGTTVSTIVTMTNIDGSDVNVFGLGFEAGGSADYSLANASPLPFIVVPGEAVEVEVAFSPSAAGYVTAVPEIGSTGSLNPVHEVFIGGVGVDTQPSATIEDVLGFFDAGVEAGTIVGTGPNDQAKMSHQRVFRSILQRAAEAIDDGKTESACQGLERSCLRSDGQLGPKDFVRGKDCAELNTMILQLMVDVGWQ